MAVHYADLVKDVREAGGPEAYIAQREAESRRAGKKEMLPWVAAAAVSASLITAGTMLAFLDNTPPKAESAEPEHKLVKPRPKCIVHLLGRALRRKRKK